MILALRGQPTPREGVGQLPAHLLEIWIRYPTDYLPPSLGTLPRKAKRRLEDDVDAADTATRDKGSPPSSTCGWDVSVRSDGRLGGYGERSSTGRLDGPCVARSSLRALGPN